MVDRRRETDNEKELWNETREGTRDREPRRTRKGNEEEKI